MTTYRTHTCAALRSADVGKTARLSGWVHRKRDHGQLLFVDLRDHYGITQCVISSECPLFEAASALRLESVVRVEGDIVARSPETVNKELATGEVELNGTTLKQGDGASITKERELRFNSKGKAEILVFELPPLHS